MNNRSMIWGGIALVVLIAVLAWGGGWLGSNDPSPAPAPATEQPAGETAPAS